MIPKEDADNMNPKRAGEMLNKALNAEKNKLTILELW
ncbi:hypothetical protein SAMN05421542_0433 [Chryseobacterium jejuense]|uniref:Uncharacterized protein n=1 Tax=Chryseobacterium jejuense TaxID=445960 RepID=A0A2X2WTQ9_CHRJE|nr:hypothetical protein SAMN05421542_0433 [Chryseobacterium jejuense]SQB46702.1 Uncharacterised protein [Chryseobacterium jejuense]